LLLCQYLQFDVAAMQDLNDSRIEAGSGLGEDLAHCLVQRERPAVGPIRSESIKTIDCGEYACANWNRLSSQSVGVPSPIPFLVMRSYNRHYRVGKIDLF
jgi:hypothetical protein